MEKDNDYSRFMPPGSREEAQKEEEHNPDTDILPPPPPPPTMTQPSMEEAQEKFGPEALLEEERETLYPEFESPWVTVVKFFFYDIFNPYLIPAYVTLLLFEVSVLSVAAPSAAPGYALTAFGATCIVPVLVLVLLRRFGIISSYSMLERRERVIPYIVQILALGGLTLLMKIQGAPLWLWLIYCGATVTALVNFLINFKFKISNHAAAIAAVVATLVVIQRVGVPQVSLAWWAVGTLIVAGVSGSIAIFTGKHTLWEVLAGYATGFLGITLMELIH